MLIRIVSATTAFLYPGYASYKTLSQRPASEAELERWLMYWSVLGCIVGVEHLAGWLVSWVPLYSTVRAIFLLYLALPQTQGATYVYTVHLRPFFASHEQQIDQAIAQVRARLYRFIQDKARALWQAVLGQQQQHQHQQQPPNTAAAAAPPPVGPAQLISSLWTAYGPSIIAGGTALLGQSADTAAGSRTANDFPSVPITPPNANNNNNNASPSVSTTSTSSSPSGLRERNHSGLKFEEIQGGEIEGYDAGGFVQQPQPGSRGSWFGFQGSS